MYQLKILITKTLALKLGEEYHQGSETGVSMAPKMDVCPLNFFTACKRSLGQGNIFTPVCHSVHRGGVRGYSGGRAWLLRGGGRAWFYSGGHAWFFQFFRIQ